MQIELTVDQTFWDSKEVNRLSALELLQHLAEAHSSERTQGCTDAAQKGRQRK